MMRFPIVTGGFLLFLAVAIAPVVHAQGVSLSETQKIEALIQYVGKMNEASFVRNGSSYDAKTAATFYGSNGGPTLW